MLTIVVCGDKIVFDSHVRIYTSTVVVSKTFRGFIRPGLLIEIRSVHEHCFV